MTQIQSETLSTPQEFYDDTILRDSLIAVLGNYSNAVTVKNANTTIEFENSTVVNSSSSNLSGVLTFGSLAMNYAGQFYDLKNGQIVLSEGSTNVFRGSAAIDPVNPNAMIDTYGIVGNDLVFTFENNSVLNVVASGRKEESEAYCLEGRSAAIYTKGALSVKGVFAGEILAETFGGTTYANGTASAFAFCADGGLQSDDNFGGTFRATSYLSERYSKDIRPNLGSYVFTANDFSIQGDFTSTLNGSSGFMEKQIAQATNNVVAWARVIGLSSAGSGSIAGNMALNISCDAHSMLSGYVAGIFSGESLAVGGDSVNTISAVHKNYGVREYNQVDSGSVEVVGASYSVISFSGNVQDNVNVRIENFAEETSYVELLSTGSSEFSLSYNAHGYKIASGEIKGDFRSQIHSRVEAIPCLMGESTIARKVEATATSSGISMESDSLLIIQGNFDGTIESAAEGASSRIRGINNNLAVSAYGISGKVPIKMTSPGTTTTEGGYLSCAGDFRGNFSVTAEGNSVEILAGHGMQSGTVNTETSSYGINAGFLMLNGDFASNISSIASGGTVSGVLGSNISVQNGSYASALWSGGLQAENISGNLLAVAQSGYVNGLKSESCAITIRGLLSGVQTVSGIVAASAETEATALYHYADADFLTVTGVLYAGNYKLGGLDTENLNSVSTELMTLLNNAEENISVLAASSLNAESAYAYYKDDSYCPTGYDDLITFANGGLAFGNIELGIGDNGVFLSDNSAVYGTISSTNGSTTIVYHLAGTENNHRFLKMTDSTSLITSQFGIYVDNALSGNYILIESDDLGTTFADKQFQIRYGKDGESLRVGSSHVFSDGTKVGLQFNEARTGIVLSVDRNVVPGGDRISPTLAADSQMNVSYDGNAAVFHWNSASDNEGVAGYYVEFDGNGYYVETNSLRIENIRNGEHWGR